MAAAPPPFPYLMANVNFLLLTSFFCLLIKGGVGGWLVSNPYLTAKMKFFLILCLVQAGLDNRTEDQNHRRTTELGQSLQTGEKTSPATWDKL